MAVIETQLDTQSESYQSNLKVMSAAVDEIRRIERQVIETARAKAPRYIKRGFITPRERLRATRMHHSAQGQSCENSPEAAVRLPSWRVFLLPGCLSAGLFR